MILWLLRQAHSRRPHDGSQISPRQRSAANRASSCALASRMDGCADVKKGSTALGLKRGRIQGSLCVDLFVLRDRACMQEEQRDVEDLFPSRSDQTRSWQQWPHGRLRYWDELEEPEMTESESAKEHGKFRSSKKSDMPPPSYSASAEACVL